jgi:transcriptional regulator with XRE-family HTH domain
VKDFLKLKRIELKLTQAELAEKANVDRSMISKLEKRPEEIDIQSKFLSEEQLGGIERALAQRIALSITRM